jgi:hypothetical protein
MCSEQIFGYKDLEVRLYITAGRLNMYCDVEYSSIVKKCKSVALEVSFISEFHEFWVVVLMHEFKELL